VGVVLNMYDTTPASDSPADLDAARRIDGQQNRWYLDAVLTGSYPQDIVADYARFTDMGFVQDGDFATISARLDWMGINYYSSNTVRGLDAPAPTAPGARPTPFVGCEDIEFVETGLPKTHMGWDVLPEGLRTTLFRVTRDYDAPPLYITENGSAYDDVVVDGEVHDADRIAYLEAHLGACLDAIADGVDLRGYYAWSLLDNFEWAWGYTRRFGIVRVDYDTQMRTPKDSARRYSEIARTGTV
jgi:beta-glucosidase